MSLKGSNYPIVRPSLDLRFAQNRRLDPRVTFQRNSVGTYVDALGVLQTAAANVPRFDHDPETGESLGLLVEESRINEMSLSVIRPDNNGIYTQWTPTNGATIQPYAALAPDGTFTAALVTFPSSGQPRINRQTAVVSGTRIVSCWIRAKTGTVTIRVGTNSDFGQNQTVGTEWTRLLEEVPSSSNFAGIYCSNPVSSAEFYVWGFQQEAGTFPTSYIPTPATFTSRASTATYYDANGVIQTAAIDVARDDAYFPDENGNFISAGLLIEESRTNFITRSEELDSTGSTDGWFPQSSSIFPNAILSPDGNTTADKLVENTLTSEHYIRTISTASVVSGNKYTISIFAKPAERSTLKIAATTGALPGSVTFDLINQTFSENGAVGHPVQVLPNGWYRCFATFTASASSTTSSYFYLSGFYAGDGTSGMYLWGAQFEAGAFPTSYIPTSGSTVTRAADVSSSSTMTRSPDVASITGTNFSSWYNQREGTVFADAKMSFALSQSDKFPDIYTSGTYPDRLWALYINNGGNNLTVGADTHSDILETFSSSPQSFKVAQALSNTSLTYSASKDGATPLTGSLRAITNTSSISIGGQVGAVKHISRLAYYPYRLSDTTLQALTS